MIYLIYIFLFIIVIGFSFAIYVLLFMWSMQRTMPIAVLKMNRMNMADIHKLREEWKNSVIGAQYHLTIMPSDVEFEVLNGNKIKEINENSTQNNLSS